MNTPTPRTDDIAGSLIDSEEVVPADFARTLERELTTERAKVKLLTIALKDAISTYDPTRKETLVTAERQEAWAAALQEETK